MPLIYSFFARGSVVLADYTGNFSGNFATVAVTCLNNIPAGQSRFTYAADGHTFNFLLADGFTFLAVAEEQFGRQIPFAFLEKVKVEFLEKFADTARGAGAHSMDRSAGPRLRYWMDYCSQHPEELSKVASVQRKVDEVKTIMVDNIEKVLERGERLELLVDKTDNLRTQADRFHQTGRQLRSKMWWQNMKLKVAAVGIFVALLFIIFCFICFGHGNCLARKQ
ncbi:hypothetical protein WJX81_005050 [Elliptochloris bilobata]|uniref:Vesicle-associated membrane protein n=1 Tax=Elliptochloris bilobata TaxID=381761 RepID=A0AAW1S0U8_9CHLO